MAALQALVKKQIEMLNKGQVLEAFDLYFAEYGVMHSNGKLFGTGRAECRRKQEIFLENFCHVRGEISDLVIDEKSEFCVFRNTLAFERTTEKHHEINGLHVQMWAGGEIVIEWYFSGDLMEEVIAAGIFSDPAHILELV